MHMGVTIPAAVAEAVGDELCWDLEYDHTCSKAAGWEGKSSRVLAPARAC